MHAKISKLYLFGQSQLWTKVLLTCLFSALTVLSVSPALAGGRVIWKKTTIEEHTKKEAWYLDLEIHLPRAPDVGQKSMKFEFTQWSEFERSLLDGKEGPQERTVPLSNQQALIESQLVGFMDPGQGKIQARTRFSFKVTRAHGYRAGQWKVKIKDGDTGALIGTETTLTFKGENPIVDRRSIVFAGTEKPKKTASAADQNASGDKNFVDLNAPDEPQQAAPSAAAAAPSDDTDDSGSSEGDGEVPPSVDERPGGGCHYGPHESGGWAWGMLLGLMGLVLMSRRLLG